jgi:hypothetical protein
MDPRWTIPSDLDRALPYDWTARDFMNSMFTKYKGISNGAVLPRTQGDSALEETPETMRIAGD